MSIRLIARLDVKPPFLVKPVHFEGLRKFGNPGEAAKRYYEQGIDEIFYEDIVASLYRRPTPLDLLKQASVGVWIPIAAGGGIASLDDIEALLMHGADKVLINTHALQEDPQLISRAAKTFGSQCIVVHVVAKRQHGGWNCRSDCGRIPSRWSALDWIREAEQRGAGELLVSSVDTDGSRRGFETELIARAVQSVGIPVVAASGAGSVAHIVDMARSARPSGIAIATLLHYQEVSIGAIRAALNPAGKES